MTEYQANVKAMQWDGTFAGAQALQTFVGKAQNVSFLQGAWPDAAPQVVLQNPDTHASVTASPQVWLILLANGAVQAMTDGAFKVAYQAKPA